LKKLWLYAVFAALFIGLGFPASQTSANTSFSDVGSSHRAQEEIYYLVEGGIANGISSTSFSPNQQVTRGQAAAMLGRALGLNGEKKATSFSDVSSNYFASGYIQQMVNKGIISGYPNGQFKPNQTLTRGEMAILISRSFGYGANTVSIASSRLMEKGIAQGYVDGSFGATDTIIRADFSVFLARGIHTQFRTSDEQTFNRLMYVNVDSLNVRTGPNTQYPSLVKVNTGQVIEYGYTVGDWSFIRVNGKEGFVHSAYIQIDVPDPNNPTPPPPVVTPPPTNSLSDIVVIIDPGHGGHDPGAQGYGYQEKNVVLNISKSIKTYFDKTPIQSKLTRTTDVFLELGARTKFASQNNGDIFISMHANALNGSANGTETFYYQTAATNPHVNESKALAKYIQNRMLQAWDLTDRGAKAGNYYVLRENTMPAALAEIGFIDNKTDNAYIASSTRRDQMAKAIFMATLDYYYHYEGRQDVLPLYNTVNGKPSPKLH
jgi:N-acetylmuramoyl-L-alanine amidase